MDRTPPAGYDERERLIWTLGFNAGTHEDGLAVDRALVSGRIDGLRFALDILSGAASPTDAQAAIQSRVDELMNTSI